MPEYASRWFASKVVGHDAVAGARVLGNGHVEIDRLGLDPVVVAPLAHDRVDVDLVSAVLEAGDPTIVMTVRHDAHYDWAARDYAQARGSVVHTYREVWTALGDPDPRKHVEQRVAYGVAVLEQHSRVASVEMICEASFTVLRKDLPPLVVAVEYEYEMTEEAMVNAVARHPEADIVYNANPNGRSTSAALTHGAYADVETYRLRELMGRLARA